MLRPDSLFVHLDFQTSMIACFGELFATPHSSLAPHDCAVDLLQTRRSLRLLRDGRRPLFTMVL